MSELRLAGPERPDLHVAIIMDGNGRWATARGWPRMVGHRAGARAVRRIVEAAPLQGIGALTLYAFSADNWSRPAPEVSALMRLMRAFLAAETQRCVENGVALHVIGRRDRIPAALCDLIASAEHSTARGTRLVLRIAIDYSARDALVKAAHRSTGEPLSREGFARALAAAVHSGDPVPDVDLLIRTGGEQRLSDFLLWECAYAELFFTPCAWPEFEERSLAAAVRWFHERDRRFGGLREATG